MEGWERVNGYVVTVTLLGISSSKLPKLRAPIAITKVHKLQRFKDSGQINGIGFLNFPDYPILLAHLGRVLLTIFLGTSSFWVSCKYSVPSTSILPLVLAYTQVTSVSYVWFP